MKNILKSIKVQLFYSNISYCDLFFGSNDTNNAKLFFLHFKLKTMSPEFFSSKQWSVKYLKKKNWFLISFQNNFCPPSHGSRNEPNTYMSIIHIHMCLNTHFVYINIQLEIRNSLLVLKLISKNLSQRKNLPMKTKKVKSNCGQSMCHVCF